MHHSNLLPLLAALFLLSPALPAQAGVIERDWKTPGDGLLTYDDVNQREWLDLTETELFKFPGDTVEEKYQAIVNETMLGGMFDEFTVATSDDVMALAESAGIVLGTLNFDTNKVAAGELADLVGPTGYQYGDSRGAGGLVSDLDPNSFSLLVIRFAGRDTSGAGIQTLPSTDIFDGVWAFRPIPEPSSIAIVFGLLALNLTSRSVRRQMQCVVC